MPTNSRPPRSKRYTRAYDLSPAVRQGKYHYERLAGSNPLVLTTASTIAALPTAGAAQVDQIWTPGGGYIEYYQTTAQTLQPIGNVKGLVIDGDQVDNESAEFVIGGNTTTNPYAMTVGTDTDFFLRVTLEITDASGSDQLVIGWRKQQTYAVPVGFLTATDPTYTDFAAIGFAATKADPNPVSTITDLNDTGTPVVTATGFTWADTKVHQLEVRVVGGKAMYLINGVRLGNPVAFDALGVAITSQNTLTGAVFTFDATDVLVPFIFVRQDADLTNAVYLRSYEVGHLVEAGLDPNAE